MPLFMRLIHDTEPFKFAYSCADECVAMTSECLVATFFFGLLEQSFRVLSSVLNTSIRGHAKKKNCFETSKL